MTDPPRSLLEVDGLSLSYQTRQAEVMAVQDVSFDYSRAYG